VHTKGNPFSLNHGLALGFLLSCTVESREIDGNSIFLAPIVVPILDRLGKFCDQLWTELRNVRAGAEHIEFQFVLFFLLIRMAGCSLTNASGASSAAAFSYLQLLLMPLLHQTAAEA